MTRYLLSRKVKTSKSVAFSRKDQKNRED